ncbi:MAG: helix-turn-helix domain-containing protein [Rhodospirillales bacterium]
MPVPVRKSKAPPPPFGCPLAECMSILGKAWAVNLIWFLSAGPRRFNELLNDIQGISSKVLSTRLREMEEDGVITRSVKPTSPPTVEYALTDLGSDLIPAITAIAEVGHKLKVRKGLCAAD